MAPVDELVQAKSGIRLNTNLIIGPQHHLLLTRCSGGILWLGNCDRVSIAGCLTPKHRTATILLWDRRRKRSRAYTEFFLN